MNTLKIMNKLLILVPHPDDEVILFGGLIQSALSKGKEVYVALLTNGDYEANSLDEGIIRPRETIMALNHLGLDDDHIFIMGYADTGMPKAESFLWKLWTAEDKQLIIPSKVTDKTYGPPEHPDFHTSVYGDPATYNKASIESDIEKLFQIVNPDMVFTTHPRDEHGDHCALYEFVHALAGKRRIWTAFCHSQLGDVAWPDDSQNFTSPPDIKKEWENVYSIELTSEEEEKKKKALGYHKAALKPDAVVFLYSFVKNNEIYFEMENNH